MPNVNVVTMAHAGLRLLLRLALHQAVTIHQRAVQERIQVQTNSDVQTINLVVEPMPALDNAAALYMVLFQDVPGAGDPASAALRAA